MLATSKFVNFKKGYRLVMPVQTRVQCPIPGMFLEELQSENEPQPVPECLEALLGPCDPMCLDDIFSDLISEQKNFSLRAS